jgi:Zn-finger nucleic acid-binding protein
VVVPKSTDGEIERRAIDPRYRMLCDIAHTNNTPVSFEADRWSNADLIARLQSIEEDNARCPQCRLTEHAAKHVNAVTDRCPTCEARDTRKRELSKLDNPSGMFVRWQVIDDPDLAARSSAFAQFTAEGARARRLHEAGGE